MCLVFQESMYSALPTKLIRRGTASIRNAESRKLMWLGQRMAGPSAGIRSKPSRCRRHRRFARGAASARQPVLQRVAPGCSSELADVTRPILRGPGCRRVWFG